MTKPKTKKTPIKTPPFSKVLPEIRSLIETSRRHVATTANLVLVNLYWNIGRVITQDIQNNEKRAGYGKQLIQELSEVLRKEYGKGFTRVNLQDMRRFFESFSICQAVPVESKLSENRKRGDPESGEKILIDFNRATHLAWTHYRILLGIKNNIKRNFYILCESMTWTISLISCFTIEDWESQPVGSSCPVVARRAKQEAGGAA